MRIQLLGRFSIRLADAQERLVPIPSPRRRALLAYLAMQPGYSETRERLATLLWGEVPDRQARQSLRQALMAMRADFAPFGVDPLRVERDTVGLDPQMITIDARELLSLATSEAPGDVARAASMLQGPFLDGVDLPAEGFTEWLQQQRQRVDAAAVIVLARAAEQASKDNGQLAIHFAERLVTLAPVRGSSHRLLLRLLARHRGRDEALARADDLAKMLRDELDVGPDAETRALVAAIKAGEVESVVQGDSQIAEVPGLLIPADGGRSSDAFATSDLPDVAPARVSEFVAGSAPRRKHYAAWAGGALGLIGSASILILVFGSPAGLFRGNSVDSTDLGANRTPLTPGVSAVTANLSAQGLNPIMVLPFSSDPAAIEAGSVADDLTDDLTSELSRVTAIRVISRSTSRLYKGKKFDIASIGTELGVRYVIDGSVQMHDGVARIDASLTDTSSRVGIWSQRFERPVSDLPSVISEITRSIARQMQVTVYLAEEARLVPKRSGDPTLEDLLARGWGAMVRSPSEGPAVNPAGFFEQALKRDPDSSSAQLGYAGSQIVPATSQLGKSVEFDLDRADRMLKLVLEKDPRQSTGLLYRGMLKRLRGDLAGARDDFLSSIEYHPSFAIAYTQAGYMFYRFGEYDRGLEFIRYAMRLSPRDPGLGVWSYMAGMIELERGNDAAAFEWLDKAVTLVPRNIYARLALAAVLVQRGDTVAAHSQMQELAHVAPWLTLATVRSRLGLYEPPANTRRRLIEGVEKAFADAR